MKTIAMVYGAFSSAIHGPFDLSGLYTTQGLTGSESSFFNLARTFAEEGHRVVAFVDCAAPWEHPSGLVCMPLKAVEALPTMSDVQVVIAWNEPDYLRYAPVGAKRIVDQQLNDWGYCQAAPPSFVDHFVFPSQSSWNNHKQWVGNSAGSVIPNSVDLGLFEGETKVDGVCGADWFNDGYGMRACGRSKGHEGPHLQYAQSSDKYLTQLPERQPHRVVYCSSPDRGLHHLLGMWPEICERISDAELKIFYRLAPWLQRCRDHGDEVGRRARFVEAALERLSSGFGIEVVDIVPNARMARELQSAAVLAYPCDPVSYTEGFGCSVLDAAAAGCLPIISDADAFGEVHGKAAVVITNNPNPQARWQTWIDNICAALCGKPTPEQRNAMQQHAVAHSRQTVAEKWDRLLSALV